MPTCARKHQLNSSLIYHIYNRSNGRVPIFNSKEDYCYLMFLLKQYSSLFSLKIYHWVIMSNHYHLLLEIESPNLISKVMAGLAKSYTNYHHKTYSTSGFLWQGRFKLQPVQKERYLIACARYIERNPVKAGIVKEAYEYFYSSARYYCLGIYDYITTEDSTFLDFGLDSASRRRKYIGFLDEFDEEEEKIFHNLEQPAGDKVFTQKLLKINGRYLQKKRGRPRGIII